MKKSIFIQITSYHDYELPKTILNAIKTSSKEVHLNFGVHSILRFSEDIDHLDNLSNVKKIISKAPKNIGMGLGRKIAHSLYDGEDYYFQIDAHSRFDEGWDTFLINEVSKHQANGFLLPIITSYPKPFWYEGNEEKTRDEEEVVLQFYWRYPDRFEMYRTPMQSTFKNPQENIFSNSISGGSLFTVGSFLEPNVKIFADGEEIHIAARAYTNGYDLLLPSKPFMYHLYYGAEGNNKRRLVWPDWPEECAELERISKEEIFATLSGEGSIGPHRLGTVRTLQEYGEFCGLDFVNGKILKNGPEMGMAYPVSQ